MSDIAFKCPACGGTFSLPQARIPDSGARGKCRCGAALIVFSDGHAALAEGNGPVPGEPSPESPRPETPPPEPPAPIWRVRKSDPDQDVDQGPFTIDQIREKVLDGQILEDDLACVHEGEWAPARAYPALATLFAEALQQHRQQHGDEEHCAVHRMTKPRWQCEKCQNYLCLECVRNEPLIEGGAPHYLCRACGGDTRPLNGNKGGLKGLLGGILGK